MAANQQSLQIKIGAVTDTASFNLLQKSLQNIINLAKQPGNELNKDLQVAAKNAQLVAQASQKAYNTKTGVLNIAKINKELEKSKVSVDKLYNSFSKMGADGANAFNTIATASMRAGVQIKKNNKLLDSFAISMANTVKWGITSGLWNKVTSEIAGAVTYVEKLDRSLNDIRIVTQKNSAAMADFAKQANKAAKTLGASTTSYTDAALIFYQQGLDDAEVKARTEVTLKTANVTKQSADAVSEQLTAVWNGYRVSAEEAEKYVDKLAAVAATTAADLEELSTGMSKVASAAASMGVDIDQLSAQLATIVSVTRQAPEAVGTALKTVYARMGDLAIGGEDEFGVSLGAVSGQLNQVGISVLDQTGNLREMGTVIEEVAGKWDMWNESQRTAVAIAIAGKRQYNNLIALFNNWDMYSEALKTSQESLGTLSRQQDIYLESTDAKLRQLSATWEKLYSTLIKTSELNIGIEGINALIEAFDRLASSFGGGIKTIGAAVAILASLTSSKIGEGLTRRAWNQEIDRQNASTINLRDKFREKGLIDTFGLVGRDGGDRAIMFEESAKANRGWLSEYDKYRNVLTNDQYNEVVKAAKAKAEIDYKIDEYKWETEQLENKRNANREDIEQKKDRKDANEKRLKAISKLNPRQLSYKERDSLIKEKATLIDDNKDLEDELKLLKQETKELEKQIELRRQKDVDREAEAEKGNIQQRLDESMGDQEFLDRASATQMQLDALAGSAILVSGAVMSIHSAFDIWSNDDLSFVEKLTQSFLTLAPSLALVFTGIKKLNIETLKGKTVTDVFTSSKIKQTLATILGVKAKKADTAATRENTIATQANASADMQETATEAISNATDQASAAGGTIGKVGKGSGKLLGKIGGIKLGIVAGVAAAGVAAIAIYNHAVKLKLEKDLKEMQTAVEETAENMTKSVEKATNMQNIVDNLQSLKEQYDNQEISLTEIQNQVYDLCIQYKEEELAVKSLAMSYEELEIASKEALESRNAQSIQSIKNYQDAQEELFNQNLKMLSNETNWYQKVFDWANWGLNHGFEFSYGIGSRGAKEKEFIKELGAIDGVNIGGREDTATFDYKKLAQNWDEFVRVINSYSGDLSGHNILKDWQQLQAKLEESGIQEYADSLSQEKDLTLVNQTLNIKKEDITNLEEYRKVYDELVESSKEQFETVKEQEDWIKGYLGTLDENVKSLMIEDVILKQLGVSSDYIKDWSEDEKNYVYLHLDAKKTAEQFEKDLSKLQDYFKIAGANKGIVLTNSLLGVEGRLSEDQVKDLYENTNFGLQSGLSQELFTKAFTESQQKTALIEYQLQQLNYIEKNREVVEQELVDSINQLNIENADVQLDYSNAARKIEWMAQQVANGKYSTKDKSLASTSEGILDLIRNPEKLATLDSQYLKSQFGLLTDTISAYDAYQSELQAQQSSLAAVKSMTADYTKVLEKAEKEYTESKNALSTLNSSYDTIKDTIKDFNDNQKFTLDNLISLMSLEPEYLATLSWENGQLKLNKEALLDIVEAKIHNAKASLVQQSLAKIDAIMQGEAKEETMEYVNALDAERIALYGTSEAWEEYIKNKYGKDLAEPVKKIVDSTSTLLDSFFKLNDSDLDGFFGKLKKITKEWDEEFDVFWTQNKIIEKLERTLEDVADVKEHLSGNELREALETENKLIEEQIKEYRKLYELQENERKRRQSELSKYGVKFNDIGEITNYEAITKAQTDALINAGTEDAEEDFNNFKEKLNNYIDLYYNQMHNTLEKVSEEEEKLIENNFEFWLSGFEDALEKFADGRELNDFTAEMSKDFAKVYEDLGLVGDNLKNNFDSLSQSTLPTLLRQIVETENEIQKMADGGTSDRFNSISEAQEFLKETTEKLRDETLNARQAAEDLYETYLSKVDQTIDKLNEFSDAFDRINLNLEYQSELIELLYGEKAYDLYSELYTTQLYTSQEELATLMQQRDTFKRLYADAAEGSKEQLKYKEQLYDLEDKINDKITEHINLLKNEYTNEINKIVDVLEKRLTGGSSFGDMEEEWNRIKEKADKYYDTVESLYQIQSLSNKMTQDINKYSYKTQQELKKIHDKEIDYLREKKNLTEYDIKAAEARYNIALKEIALEEAQNNKNTMKLVRNAQGDWTYQYVANQDDIKQKQQDLLDSYNNLYELADDAYTNNIDSITELNKNYLQAIKDISLDEVLTQEEKTEKLKKIQEDYLEDYKLLVEENKLYTEDLTLAYNANLVTLFNTNNENMQRLTNEEEQFVKEMIAANISSFNGLKDWFSKESISTDDTLKGKMIGIMKAGYESWNEQAQGMIALWDGSTKDGGISIKGAISNAIDSIIGELSKFNSNVALLGFTVNQNFNKGGIIDSFKEARDKASDLASELVNSLPILESELTNFATTVDLIASSWSGVAEQVQSVIDKYQAFLNMESPVTKTTVIETRYETHGGGESAGAFATPKDNTINTNNTNDSPGISTSIPSSISASLAGIGASIRGGVSTTANGLATLVGDADVFSNNFKGYNKNSKGIIGQGQRIKIVSTNTKRDHPYEIQLVDKNGKPYGKSYYADKEDLILPAYASGGYTGEWGSSGRLAILHQKELVLNQEDTKNFLTATNTLRTLTSINGSINEAIMRGISRMVLEMSGFNNHVNYNTEASKVSENVTYEIHAEFPDANDVNAIREAILSLPNLASQRVSKYSPV